MKTSKIQSDVVSDQPAASCWSLVAPSAETPLHRLLLSRSITSDPLFKPSSSSVDIAGDYLPSSRNRGAVATLKNDALTWLKVGGKNSGDAATKSDANCWSKGGAAVAKIYATSLAVDEGPAPVVEKYAVRWSTASSGVCPVGDCSPISPRPAKNNAVVLVKKSSEDSCSSHDSAMSQTLDFPQQHQKHLELKNRPLSAASRLVSSGGALSSTVGGLADETLDSNCRKVLDFLYVSNSSQTSLNRRLLCKLNVQFFVDLRMPPSMASLRRSPSCVSVASSASSEMGLACPCPSGDHPRTVFTVFAKTSMTATNAGCHKKLGVMWSDGKFHDAVCCMCGRGVVSQWWGRGRGRGGIPAEAKLFKSCCRDPGKSNGKHSNKFEAKLSAQNADDILLHFDEVNKFIAKARSQNRRALIFDQSPTLTSCRAFAVQYLMFYYDMKYADAAQFFDAQSEGHVVLPIVPLPLPTDPEVQPRSTCDADPLQPFSSSLSETAATFDLALRRWEEQRRHNSSDETKNGKMDGEKGSPPTVTFRQRCLTTFTSAGDTGDDSKSTRSLSASSKEGADKKPPRIVAWK